MTLINTFGLEEYVAIIQAFKSNGYKFVTFDEFNPAEMYQVLWRHDYDFIVDDWLYVQDAINGVKANHFFMVDGPYNLAFVQNWMLLNRIKGAEHLIGLHFDWRGISKLHLSMSAMRRTHHADKILGLTDKYMDTSKPQLYYSFHKPRKNGDLRLDGARVCVYDDPYYVDPGKHLYPKVTYLSDSGGQWRFGHPIERLREMKDDERAGGNFHILTHPVWWNPEERKTNQRNYAHRKLVKRESAQYASWAKEEMGL